MTKIVLLDIDGVLVHPGGYRAALRTTFNYFVNLMGLPYSDVSEEVLTGLEKRGISSEWDMVPLLLGALWDDVLSHHPQVNFSDDLFSASLEIKKYIDGYMPSDLFIPEFELMSGKYPADSALQQNCFLKIPMSLRKSILENSRNVHRSQITRIFQHYSLGSRAFHRTYDLPAEFETESFLLLHDKSNINDAIRENLKKPDKYLAAFTARPSAPPLEISGSVLGYAPEAEFALDLVGLPDIPLIAFGKLQYLASQKGLDAVTLVKPSPVHALSAIGAAFTRDEWSALRAARDWQVTGQLNGILAKLPKKFDLIVVEDTMGGIRSTRKAGGILQGAGFDVNIQAYGLTSGSASKAEAFEQFDVPYFEDWSALMNGVEL